MNVPGRDSPPSSYPSAEIWKQALSTRLRYCSVFQHSAGVDERTRLQQMIDGDVASIESVLQSLRKTRNSLALVSRLPPELLSRIFYFSTIFNSGAGQRRGPKKPTSAIVAVSHVCHSWRQIALENSSLWAYVPSRAGRRWMEEFPRRSRSLPLSVSISIPHDVECAATILETHVERITSLSVTGNEADDPETASVKSFMDLLTLPMPALHHFDILYGVDEATWHEWGFERRLVVSLPEGLFGNHAPSLQTLSLRMVNLHWPPPSSFTNLEILIIDWYSPIYTVWTQPDFPTIPQIYSLIEKNPNLRTLKLKSCLPDHSTQPAASLPAVDLSQLRELELLDWAPDCFAVLKLINVPSECRLRLTCKDLHPSYVEDYQLLLTWISSHYHLLVNDHSTLTLTAALDPTEFRFKIASTVRCDLRNSSQLPPLDDAPLAELTLEFPCISISDTEFMPMAQQTLHSLPVTSISTMAISAPTRQPTQKELYDLLLPYSALRCLRVIVRHGSGGRGADRINRSLPVLRGRSRVATSNATGSASSQGAFLPNLSLIELGCLGFLFDPPNTGDDDRTLLYNTLFNTASGPKHLSTLIVKECQVSGSEFTTLKELLPDISVIITEHEHDDSIED